MNGHSDLDCLYGLVVKMALLLGLLVGLGGAAQAADGPEQELQTLQERLDSIGEALEKRKSAQAEEASGAMAGGADPTGSDFFGRDVVSSLSAFLNKVDILGLVAVGYANRWNEYVPMGATDRENISRGSFELHQAWLEMDKVATDESRAGFNIAIVMGSLGPYVEPDDPPGVFSAYVSYLAPLGDGIRIKAGILPTALGAEYARQDLNWNVTRGFLWHLQPITSTGITARYNVTDSFSIMVGAINEPYASARNATFDQKALTGQVSFERETWGIKAGVNYGRSGGRAIPNSDPALETVLPQEYRAGLYDVVFNWNPFENLGFWANWDYHFGEDADGNHIAGVNAIAVALRLAATETIGFAFRYEWIGVDTPDRPTIQSFTATFSRQITDSLHGNIEYRYNQVEENPYIGLATGPGFTGTFKGNLIYTQLMYEF